ASAIADHAGVRLSMGDQAAGVVGLGYGAAWGTLMPSLGQPQWTDSRTAAGGTLLVSSLGAVGSVALAHATQASIGEVAVPTVAAPLGAGIGAGIGLLLPCSAAAGCTSQAPRVGGFAGSLALTAAALALEPKLHLATSVGASAPTLAALGATFGLADGLLVAGALDSHGVVDRTPDRQLAGGALLGASTEMAAGLLLSTVANPRGNDAAVLIGGKAGGALLGTGASLLINDHGGRADTLSALGGSLVGLGAAAVLQAKAPLGRAQSDGVALAAGGGFGAVVGTLAPTLGQSRFPDGGRQVAGGLLVGTTGGAAGGLLVARAAGASTRDVELTTLGSADGALAGLGIGLLAGHADSSQSERIGVVAGAGVGVAVGALAWPRLGFEGGDGPFTALGTAVAGWTGGLLPTLGHARSEDFSARLIAGGAMAGVGLGSMGASLLSPALHPSTDAVENAAGMDALFSLAGAGGGLLASTRADAPAWGALTAGTLGLTLGGALHERIALDGGDAPLMSLAAVEGLWLGGWLPALLFTPEEINARRVGGGVLAGGATGLGLAILASGSGALDISVRRQGLTLAGSAVGASLGGGLSLLAPSALGGQRGAGMVMGGTAAGLVAGALLEPDPSVSGGHIAVGATAGAALGAAEATVFGWSARATGDRSYTGAGLVGAAVGASLGLAAATAAPEGKGQSPATAGFAAWGAWMGSFTGSLFRNDAHEVVLGGLVGANLGFLGGYALLQSNLVEPRDFGWLSLFGALGTVVGAGAGAPFASSESAMPVRAGMAVGP
ncbi:MAG TPA: hypothetical protein VNO55_25660, partial [Polyangia bacterium]|nr:hypothetical protein [Polyangia bacterium]